MRRVVAWFVVIATGFTNSAASESTCRYEVQERCRIGTQHSMLQKNIAHSAAAFPIDEGGPELEEDRHMFNVPVRGTDGGMIGVTRDAGSAGIHHQRDESLGTDKADKKRHAAVKKIPTEVISSRKTTRTPSSQDHEMRKRKIMKTDSNEAAPQTGRNNQNIPKAPGSYGHEMRNQEEVKRIPAEVFSSHHAKSPQRSDRAAIVRERSQPTSASPTRRSRNHGVQDEQHDAKNKQARLSQAGPLAKSAETAATPLRHDILEREGLEKAKTGDEKRKLQRRHAKHGKSKVESFRHHEESSDDSIAHSGKIVGKDSRGHPIRHSEEKDEKIAGEDLRTPENTEHAMRHSEEEDEITEERQEDEGHKKMSWAEKKKKHTSGQPSLQELANLANSLARDFMGGGETGDEPQSDEPQTDEPDDFKDEFEEEQEILQSSDQEEEALASDTEKVDVDTRKKKTKSGQASEDQGGKDKKRRQDARESSNKKASSEKARTKKDVKKPARAAKMHPARHDDA